MSKQDKNVRELSFDVLSQSASCWSRDWFNLSDKWNFLDPLVPAWYL